MTDSLLFLAIALIFAAFAFSFQMLGLSRRRLAAERDVIEAYRRKIDKIPALIETMRRLDAHEKATKELKELHRMAISSSAERIYDVFEMDAHISERFAFLMRLSLALPAFQKDANFITVRESVVRGEGAVRSCVNAYSKVVSQYNRAVARRNWTLVGLVLPGHRLPTVRT